MFNLYTPHELFLVSMGLTYSYENFICQLLTCIFSAFSGGISGGYHW